MAFNFEQKLQELKRLKSNLPLIVGNIAKRHFVKSFKDGGFTDVNLDPWAKRKRLDKSDRRTGTNRAILVKSGHLRGSIRVKVANFNKIEIGAYGVPYARYHNQGVGKMPKRQFIGQSRLMTRKISKRIKQEIVKIL